MYIERSCHGDGSTHFPVFLQQVGEATAKKERRGGGTVAPTHTTTQQISSSSSLERVKTHRKCFLPIASAFRNGGVSPLQKNNGERKFTHFTH